VQAASNGASGNWKQASVRRLRVGAAIAILAVAACVDDAASDKAASRDTPLSTEKQQAATSAGPKVEISALSGVPPTEANLFSAMLKEEALRTTLPASASEGVPAFDVTGAMAAGERDDGTYIVAVVDITNTKGLRLERVVSDTLLPERGKAGNAWDSVGKDDLRRLASTTASKIAAWYAGTFAVGGTIAENTATDPVVTGSIAATAPDKEPAPRFRVVVGPAPGDGATSLSRALEKALNQRMPMATWITGGPYRIDGSIVTASRNDGLTDVSIRWLVKTEDGALLGEVEQHNALDAAKIASRWEDVAKAAADAAAEGVMGVLQGPPFPVASNS
jgi:hypothetical protein|tara:strand:- start:9253 stop:10254 length:1002 start_codon:yes stop_codon:yes gene_type:complete